VFGCLRVLLVFQHIEIRLLIVDNFLLFPLSVASSIVFLNAMYMLIKFVRARALPKMINGSRGIKW
jgi:hypothetical protein